MKSKQEINEWLSSKEKPFVFAKDNYTIAIDHNGHIRAELCRAVRCTRNIHFGDNPNIVKEFIEFCGSKEHAIKYWRGELE